MIRVSGLRKRFGSNEVLRGIDLEVREGRVTALIGPSGSGKSTLLRCLNLLEAPDGGELELDGAPIRFEPGRRLDARQVLAIRRSTGMVFQNFQLFPHRTALGNVMEGLVVVLGWPQERARARATELLAKVGLADKAESYPATLSGGQQQRVAIARALAASPKLLLCDEPTSALDPELAAEVVEVLGALAGEGTTMLIATHDLRLADRMAHHVAFLQDGVVVEEGSPDRLFRQAADPRTIRFVRTLSGGT
ncbi:amino acid ABC transporter ATP-binding protein [Aureimonas sp. AU4]|uniref:amino acid ABC transporter ATP-binding protein n=1 Tax=Aureimonas sp. AU4 TaxID=1638163 RepID=UPI0007862F95|nr:amino acid ABC transporter ATP-binding protein [Aureimonas sp. AU4]